MRGLRPRRVRPLSPASIAFHTPGFFMPRGHVSSRHRSERAFVPCHVIERCQHVQLNLTGPRPQLPGLLPPGLKQSQRRGKPRACRARGLLDPVLVGQVRPPVRHRATRRVSNTLLPRWTVSPGTTRLPRRWLAPVLLFNILLKGVFVASGAAICSEGQTLAC